MEKLKLSKLDRLVYNYVQYIIIIGPALGILGFAIESSLSALSGVILGGIAFLVTLFHEGPHSLDYDTKVLRYIKEKKRIIDLTVIPELKQEKIENLIKEIDYLSKDEGIDLISFIYKSDVAKIKKEIISLKENG